MLRNFVVASLLVLIGTQDSWAGKQVDKSSKFMADFEALDKVPNYKRTDYIRLVGRVLARMEEAQEIPLEARSSRPRDPLFGILMGFNNIAWAGGGHDHDHGAPKEATPKRTAPLIPPQTQQEAPEPAPASAPAARREVAQPAALEPPVQLRPKEGRPAAAAPSTQTNVSADEQTAAIGAQCDPGSQSCCIHSGNFIPLTNGRCLGGAYIGCSTKEGRRGFQCNPIFFGQNEVTKAPYCVEKAPPHAYTSQCVKVADSSNSKPIAANKADWDRIKEVLKSYCESDNLPKHNVANCETLKERAETFGQAAASGGSSERAGGTTR